LQASDWKLYSRLHYWLLLTTTGNSRVTQELNTDTPEASKGRVHTTPADDNLFFSNDNSLIISQEDRLISALGQLDLSVESRVTLSRPGPEVDTILLQEVYRIKRGSHLIFTLPRYWTPGRPIPRGPRRDNYDGLVFPTATVVSVRTKVW
jgi:hypothetical protein